MRALYTPVINGSRHLPFSDAAKRSQGRKRDGLVDHIDAIDDGWIDDEDSGAA